MTPSLLSSDEIAHLISLVEDNVSPDRKRGGVRDIMQRVPELRAVADKAKVIELATKLGYLIEECQMNEVRYLRVISIGICDLGMKIIGDLYGIKPNAELEMITEGFKWLPME